MVNTICCDKGKSVIADPAPVINYCTFWKVIALQLGTLTKIENLNSV